MSDERIVIALGANLGDARATLLAAMAELERLGAPPFERSSLWTSTPVDCPPGSPEFLNAVFLMRPGAIASPDAMLSNLQALETQFGRTAKKVHNEARPLDLDLIAFGGETRDTPELTLPHPRAVDRGFVLAPLAEVAPGFRAPGWPGTAAECLARTERDPELRPVSFT